MKYYSSNAVTKLLGVTAQTLRNWDKEGKLKPAYTKSNGYRYYSEDSILSYTQERKTKKDLHVIGYARVSSKNESDDLERQVDNLRTYIESKYSSYEIITDIGSSINYKKPGLKKLIDMVNKKQVDIIVVLYKDRLLRFCFELVEADKWYPSSKKCSNCGNIKEDLSLSDRIYHCPKCGLEIDRDYNASINLKNYCLSK